MAEIVGQRLEDLIELRRTTQSKVAAAIGLSQPSIGRMISGETRETGKLLELARVLKTTPEYLVGESNERDLPEVSEGRRAYAAEPVEDADLVELDEVDLRYGLGGTYMDGPISVEKRPFSREWLRMIAPQSSPSYLFWAVGDGDSMEPTIRSGEVILIDRSNLTPRMGEGIWALAWGDVGMVKRVRPRPDGSIELLSDNSSVPPIMASDEEVHVIGRVVAVVRRL